ncbi:MAG: SDR family NAD(P)-dependent oxidoreductase [Myxococcota bacterium]|nr:SDR family NAD(P)-dependent oxidoreductase [Myxococcota bacterium]
MKVTTETVALITGASRGIGVDIVRHLAQRGAKLVLAARNQEKLEAVAAEARSLGSETLVRPTDLSLREDTEALVRDARSHFGHIDLLVNNAGVEHYAFFEEVSLDDLEWTTRINVTAPMALARLVLPGMLERNSGHIVNVASLAGLGPTAFGEAYGASKHAVVGFTRALRASLQTRGSGVSASVICPGFISDVGMFADKQAAHEGVEPVAFLGTSPPAAVARAVLRATEKDLPEVIVNRGPLRLSLALAMVFPRLGEWLGRFLGVHQTNYTAAQSVSTTRQ